MVNNPNTKTTSRYVKGDIYPHRKMCKINKQFTKKKYKEMAVNLM